LDLDWLRLLELDLWFRHRRSCLRELRLVGLGRLEGLVDLVVHLDQKHQVHLVDRLDRRDQLVLVRRLVLVRQELADHLELP
jgi:hypothetical protein